MVKNYKLMMGSLMSRWWIRHMSVYSFIATDYVIPELDNTISRFIRVQEAIEMGIEAHKFMPWERMDPNEKILYFEKESDFYELVISKDNSFEMNVRWYTEKPFIYSINFRYSEPRVTQLLQYLRENIKEGSQVELWSIWLDDEESIRSTVHSYEEISINDLKQLYDWKEGSRFGHGCIVIKRGN
jgi:hypothetical protein